MYRVSRDVWPVLSDVLCGTFGTKMSNNYSSLRHRYQFMHQLNVALNKISFSTRLNLRHFNVHNNIEVLKLLKNTCSKGTPNTACNLPVLGPFNPYPTNVENRVSS